MAQKRKSLTLPGTLFDAARKLFERLPMTAHSDERGYTKRLTDVFAPSAALFSRPDCAFNLLLPATLPAAGHRTFGSSGTKMVDLLPLGFRRPMMIVLGLAASAGLMRRLHVVRFIQPSDSSARTCSVIQRSRTPSIGW